MKNKNKKILIGLVILIGILLFAKFSGFLAIFQPTETGIGQYTSYPFQSASTGGANLGYEMMQEGVVSKETEINTGKNNFKFVAKYFTSPNPISQGCGWKCQLKLEVYKDGNLVDTLSTYNGIDECVANRVDKDYCDNIGSCINAHITNDYNDNTRLDPRQGLYDWTGVPGQYNACESWRINYKLKLSPNAVNVEVLSPQKTYIQGQDIKIDLKLKNNLNSKIKANLTVEFGVETILGVLGKEETREIELNPGEIVFNYTFPTNKPVDKLIVKPTLTLNLYGGNFKNLNYGFINRKVTYWTGIGTDSSNVDLPQLVTSERTIPVGEIKDEFMVSVSPKPLFLAKVGDACPLEYVLSNNKQYCVRSDVREISCVILGCPVMAGHEYQCTSSGYCAELVYVYVDCTTRGCPLIEGTNVTCLSNGVCRYINETTKEIIKEIRITCAEDSTLCPQGTTCDASAKVCIKTEIYIELVEKKCLRDEHCPDTYKCDLPTGLCYKNIYIEKTCSSDSDCPDTYKCDSKTGLCFKETTIALQCTKDLDCIIPCEGMKAVCNIMGQCVYSGECRKVEIGCKEYGCAEGFNCNRELNVCQKETIVEKITEKIPVWIWIVLGIVFILFIIAIIWLIRKII